MSIKQTFYVVTFCFLATVMVGAQNADQYLVSISINKAMELSHFENFRLPVYHQFDQALIVGISEDNLKELHEAHIPAKIIDVHPWSEPYFIITNKAGGVLHIKSSWGKVLFQDRHSVLLKTVSVPVEEIFSARYQVSKMTQLPKFIKNEKCIGHLSTSLDKLSSGIDDVLAEINPDTIEYFIQTLQDFGTRFLLHPNRDSIASWIKGEFSRMGYADVQFDSFLCHNPWPNDTTTWQKNVVATFPGTVYPDQIYIIGGHYDSYSSGNPMLLAPGADDNASGTTAALEIARAMKAANYQPESTIKFIAFAAEELMITGDSGSKYFAQTANATGMDIKLMINNDMISHTYSPVGNSRVAINYYSGFYHLLDIATFVTNNYSAIRAVNGTQNQWSDSYPFWLNGFPAIYFEENDFSPYYHTPQDVISNYSMEFCAEIVKASGALLMYMIQTPAIVEGFQVLDNGTGHSLWLSWHQNTELDLAGYHIYLGEISGVYDTTFTTADSTFIIGNLDEGTEYFVGIAAFDVNGNEGMIVEKSATPYSVPLAPSNVYDEPDWNEVGIHWSPNQEIDLAGYNIYRADSSGGSPVQLNASLVQDTFWVDNSTANGVYYYYTVRAVDNDQNQSQISEEVRSRAISMDQGILIVDKTADGNGTPMNPTDQEVDDFFNALLSHYPVSEYDVNAEGGIKLADLGAFSSVVWHTNALSDLTLALEARESIGEYLDFGGNLLITSYQPTKVFFNNINYPASFSPGDFIYDYLKIAQVDFNPPARFYGAYPIMSGYDSVYVDTIKTAFATDHHLVRIESISAVAGADEIYRYDSQYASTTPQGSMKGSPVGVEYLGSDFRMIILSFPLYYMDLLQTQSLMSHIMSDKFSETTEVKEELVISPHGFRLSQNYPNPFNPGTIIEFSLPRSGFVTLTVFNTLGQQIATLISERLNAGNHRYYWNARRLASGLYFYKLETDEYRSIKKALLLK